MIGIHGRNIVMLGSTGPVQPTGNKVLFNGDSITAGAGVSAGQPYFSVYGSDTGHIISTMAKYTKTVQENVQSYNATNSLYNNCFNPTAEQAQYTPVIDFSSDYRYICFRFGINDCLQKPGSSTNAASFQTAYIECLEYYQSKGWPSAKIKLIGIGSYLGVNAEVSQAVLDYNQAIIQIGALKNFQVIDIYNLDGANNRASLYADDVHPNDAGHLLHGHYIASQIS